MLLAVSLLFKSNCLIEIKDTPGPGTYKILSTFDKFKRLPAKQYQQLKEKGSLSPAKGRHDDLDLLENNNDLWYVQAP